MDQPAIAGIAQDFVDRAQARPALDIPPFLTDPAVTPKRGDHDLEPIMAAIAEVRPIRPAAVLIPIVEREEPMVLLTERTADLKDHAGQIAFPGGKIDATDLTPKDAALREACEEIGLPPSYAAPIGYLDIYMTTRGYRILPTLARVRPDFTLKPNPSEVADVFEVPLAFLMQ